MEYREFEKMICDLDVRIFDKIPSETTFSDKRSLLFLQRAVREANSSYVYLEIGSHLGGSIQAHLMDRNCIKIYSIDKRSPSQADERCDNGFAYPENTTDRMLQNLKSITGDLKKLSCLDDDVASINRAQIEQGPDLCLIDGEHTNEAAVNDFHFCRSILRPDGIILFHDAIVISQGLRKILNDLNNGCEKFSVYYFSSTIVAVVFGSKYENLKKLQIRSCIARAKMALLRILPESAKAAIAKMLRRPS